VSAKENTVNLLAVPGRIRAAARMRRRLPPLGSTTVKNGGQLCEISMKSALCLDAPLPRIGHFR